MPVAPPPEHKLQTRISIFDLQVTSCETLCLYNFICSPSWYILWYSLLLLPFRVPCQSMSCYAVSLFSQCMCPIHLHFLSPAVPNSCGLFCVLSQKAVVPRSAFTLVNLTRLIRFWFCLFLGLNLPFRFFLLLRFFYRNIGTPYGDRMGSWSANSDASHQLLVDDHCLIKLNSLTERSLVDLQEQVCYMHVDTSCIERMDKSVNILYFSVIYARYMHTVFVLTGVVCLKYNESTTRKGKMSGRPACPVPHSFTLKFVHSFRLIASLAPSSYGCMFKKKTYQKRQYNNYIKTNLYRPVPRTRLLPAVTRHWIYSVRTIGKSNLEEDIQNLSSLLCRRLRKHLVRISKIVCQDKPLQDLLLANYLP